MKVYVQYEQTITASWSQEELKFLPCKPFQLDMCGSDSVMILDGRLSLDNMTYEATKQMKLLNRNVTGFRIIRSDNLRGGGSVLIAIRKLKIIR